MTAAPWGRWLTFLESLEYPIAFLDTETTSLEIERARVIEVAIAVYGREDMLDGTCPKVQAGPPGLLYTYHSYVNPGAAVLSSSAFRRSQGTHKISAETLSAAPPAGEVFCPDNPIFTVLDRSHLAGHNVIGYDAQVLTRMREVALCESVHRVFAEPGIDEAIDTQRLGEKLAAETPRPEAATSAPIGATHEGLGSIKLRLNALVDMLCGRPHADAHGALPDVLASAEVFARMIELWPQALGGEEGSPSEKSLLAYLSTPPRGCCDWDGFIRLEGEEWVFQRGKCRGQSLAEVDRGYLRWMLDPGRDFAPATLRIVKQHLRNPGTFAYRG